MKTKQLPVESLLEYTRSKPTAIDAEAGIIRGVKILGYESANGRVYDRAAVGRAITKYEGRSVYFDHSVKPRSVYEKGGMVRNVEQRDDGLYGDLHLLKSHEATARVLEAAEKMPDAFGLSHNVDGRVSKKNGRAVVEEISLVRSVDIVSDPATTKGMFESIIGDDEMSSEQIAEAVATATADLTAKLTAIAEQLDKAEKARAEAESKLSATVAEGNCRKLLESVGVEAKPIFVSALLKCDSDDDRKSLAESWKAAAIAAVPRSGRGFQDAGDSYELPKTTAEFLSRIR